jgi:exodeoxyribonuclease V alpha subunit
MATATEEFGGPDRATMPLPGHAPAELAGYVAARAITLDDVAAAATLVDMARRNVPTLEPDLRAWVAVCLALRTPRDGHTCVDFSAARDWAGDIDLAAADHLDWPPAASAWTASLASAGPLVGRPGDRAPFILDGTRFYLARALHEEQQIARRLRDRRGEPVAILLGGPGTGKTTRVATRLIEILQDKPEARISLAAPTGKAAARMAEALRARLHDETAPPEVRDAPQHVRDAVMAVRPLTIHKLLGHRPQGTPRYRFNATTRLDCELVVVDEASMMSSSLMHHLLAALGDSTQLLLVGDPNQLASVDAGSVLGDIARAAAQAGSPLAGRTETLTIRHRFGPRIGALADAILAGDDHGVARTLEILEGRWTPPSDPRNTKPDDPGSIRWLDPGRASLAGLVAEVVDQARRVCDLAADRHTAAALSAQRKLQVLCAHRAGPGGVGGWNARVAERLGVADGTAWYAGRPVMVTRNNPALDLFNGDVGVVVPGGDDGRMDVAFPMAGGEPRLVPVSRLEDVETVHALTIHKSQGSEYEHVVVVLPEHASRIVTRELLYTAVTRASERVTVVGSREVIEAGIRRPIRRATGLAERLAGS